MRLRLITLAALVLAVGVTACGTTTTARSGAAQWHGKIYVGGPETGEAEGNFVANATVSQLTSSTARSTITLRGRMPQGEYPWYVHVGTCAEGSDGPIIGNPDDYPMVESGAEGFGGATANLEIALDPAGSYYVNIHSKDDMTTILACGQMEK
jgi:hypothetical protein